MATYRLSKRLRTTLVVDAGRPRLVDRSRYRWGDNATSVLPERGSARAWEADCEQFRLAFSGLAFERADSALKLGAASIADAGGAITAVTAHSAGVAHLWVQQGGNTLYGSAPAPGQAPLTVDVYSPIGGVAGDGVRRSWAVCAAEVEAPSTATVETVAWVHATPYVVGIAGAPDTGAVPDDRDATPVDAVAGSMWTSIAPYAGALYAVNMAGQVARSSDGRNWAVVHSVGSSDSVPRLLPYGTVLVVKRDNDGDVHKFDGTAWTTYNDGAAYYARASAWNLDGGSAFGFDSSRYMEEVLAGSDNWTDTTRSGLSYSDPIYSAAAGSRYLVLYLNGGAHKLQVSDDRAATWADVSGAIDGVQLHAVAVAPNGTRLAAAVGKVFVNSASVGTTGWVEVAVGFDTPSCAAWIGDQFVVCDDAGQYTTSADGLAWTTVKRHTLSDSTAPTRAMSAGQLAGITTLGTFDGRLVQLAGAAVDVPGAGYSGTVDAAPTVAVSIGSVVSAEYTAGAVVATVHIPGVGSNALRMAQFASQSRAIGTSRSGYQLVSAGEAGVFHARSNRVSALTNVRLSAKARLRGVNDPDPPEGTIGFLSLRVGTTATLVRRGDWDGRFTVRDSATVRGSAYIRNAATCVAYRDAAKAGDAWRLGTNVRLRISDGLVAADALRTNTPVRLAWREAARVIDRMRGRGSWALAVRIDEGAATRVACPVLLDAAWDGTNTYLLTAQGVFVLDGAPGAAAVELAPVVGNRLRLDAVLLTAGGEDVKVEVGAAQGRYTYAAPRAGQEQTVRVPIGRGLSGQQLQCTVRGTGLTLQNLDVRAEEIVR